MWTIQIAKSADKVLKKAPLEIRNAFDAWKNVIQLQKTQTFRISNINRSSIDSKKEFNISIPDEQAETITTVGQAVSYLEENAK
jgi:acyl carrier protein